MAERPDLEWPTDQDWLRWMRTVDGCPGCVANVEAPISAGPCPGGYQCEYLCSDCGHEWTTAWNEARPAGAPSSATGAVQSKVGGTPPARREGRPPDQGNRPSEAAPPA